MILHIKLKPCDLDYVKGDINSYSVRGFVRCCPLKYCKVWHCGVGLGMEVKKQWRIY